MQRIEFRPSTDAPLAFSASDVSWLERKELQHGQDVSIRNIAQMEMQR
jgi:hypothetical protein